MLTRRRALMAEAGVFGAYDSVANLAHIYEPARCVLTAYKGEPLLRLRRASDDAQGNFSHVGTGSELDLASIAAWAGGASYIVTIYDQVGNDDITQGTDADQPLFTAAAKNGHAGGTFDGTDDFLQGAFTTGGALSQPFAFYAVAQLDATAIGDDKNHFMTDGDDATNRAILAQYPAETPDNWGIHMGNWLAGTPASDANWNVWATLMNGANSQFWINTTSQGSGNAGAQNPDGLTIGGGQAGTDYFWKGPICSVVIVDPVHSDAQRIAFEALANIYWTCY